jgi:phage baseplate assembly protein W
MPSKRVSRAFKDISFSFDPHPVTKDLPVLINERAIVRSVRNLVETIPTERFFNSDLGSDVRRSLFDFVDVGTARIVQDQITDTIQFYEDRVENIEVQVVNHRVMCQRCLILILVVALSCLGGDLL